MDGLANISIDLIKYLPFEFTDVTQLKNDGTLQAGYLTVPVKRCSIFMQMKM